MVPIVEEVVPANNVETKPKIEKKVKPKNIEARANTEPKRVRA